MSGVVSVYAVFADADEAERIGRAMIDAGHAACVNILAACRSIYRWHGKIEEAAEVPALFKTTREKSEALVAAIRKAHSYDVPAIVVWPIEAGDADYLSWVSASVF
jgi:periplasmic divalent cation tolerance protein